MYRNEILQGIDFLVSVQNADGGIPGMQMTGTSACWTTAEALESVLLSPYLKLTYHPFVFRMINFLLATQITNGNNKGAWPEYVSTSNAQTLTTGHAVAALRLAKDIIVDDQAKAEQIQKSIEAGLEYLNAVQNHDGGWSIEPEDGENNESRAFSTIFVLRGYIQNGYTFINSKVVREACQFLISLKDAKTGGFSQNLSSAPDTCYTARIVSTLIKAKAYKPQDAIIKKACKFILQDKTLKTLFKIKYESYVSDGSSGMVIFHSNTPIDVMEALCLCNIYDRRVKRLGKWIVDTQEDNGGWYLGGSRDPQINEGVITWTTNEGIFALSCCNKAFSEKYTYILQRTASFFSKASLALLAIIIGLILNPSLIANGNVLSALWQKVPTTAQQFIQATAITGIVINMFSSYIYDMLKKLLKGSDD